MSHPAFPQSNVSKFSGYHPDKYTLGAVSQIVKTDESLTPNRPPRLTQQTISKFLQPLTKELEEVQPRPTIDELPEEVIDNMVQKDKAFWVDRPGVNAYALHDAFYNYGMSSKKVLPVHQDVFPRSYQYDLDCVKYRRHHACDRLKEAGSDMKKSLGEHCKVCTKGGVVKDTYVFGSESTQERWRSYPNLTTVLPPNQIREKMAEVGLPFKNEACNWYYKHYPSQKFNRIIRKFSN